MFLRHGTQRPALAASARNRNIANRRRSDLERFTITYRGERVMKNLRLQAIVILAAGGLLGYVAASGKFGLSPVAVSAIAGGLEGDAKGHLPVNADPDTPAKGGWHL